MVCCKRKDYEALDEQRPRESPRNLIAFFLAGLINNFGYVVMLSAAEDMLQGYDIPVSAVLVADIVPSLLVQAAAPWFMQSIPYWLRVSGVVVFGIASFILPAVACAIWLKFFGIVLGSIACGFGEITFLALTSHFDKNTVSTFSSGTGGAGVLGSVFYLALTSWIGLSASVSLYICSGFPLVLGLAFLLMKPSEPLSKRIESINEPEKPKRVLSPKEKLRLTIPLLKYTVPLFFVYFAEYLINQSVDPVLTFPYTHWACKEYVYYQALYQVGVFISRSSVNIVPLPAVWPPALLQVLTCIYMAAAAVTSFSGNLSQHPNYIIIFFGIIFWEGLLGGSVYVNSFYLISQEFQDEEKEFAMGATSMGYALGITISAFFGLWFGPFLAQQHCDYTGFFANGTTCHANASSWVNGTACYTAVVNSSTCH